ncbi:MAG: hypothetical protein ACLQJR_35735 [Stellaceae bacterium]
MKALAISAATAAVFGFATLSYGQTPTPTTPGANPEFPAAGAPANAPSLKEELKKTPGSSVNPEFPAAGAPANAPSLKEQLTKTPGSSVNPEFPAPDTPIIDKKN